MFLLLFKLLHILKFWERLALNCIILLDYYLISELTDIRCCVIVLTFTISIYPNSVHLNKQLFCMLDPCEYDAISPVSLQPSNLHPIHLYYFHCHLASYSHALGIHFTNNSLISSFNAYTSSQLSLLYYFEGQKPEMLYIYIAVKYWSTGV